MVVLYHFDSKYIPELIYNNTIIRHSNSFVDLFFVLSGFVILYNYRYLSIKNLAFFAKKRFWRLYPLMIFTSTLFLIYIYYILEGSYENKFLAESISTPLVYGVLIFIISLSNGFISEILSSKLMCFLGKISYSIYLNHLIIIFCFRDVFFNHLDFHNSIQNQLFYMVSCLSIILLFSNLTFNFIEKKYNRYA